MLSSGVRERTILTTDIVGSTSLLRRYPNDMMEAMDLHDRILHMAVRDHFGDPFRHTGDGVIAIFERPLDAVLAAIVTQRQMRLAAWGPMGRLKLRYGIHTGQIRARGTNDFFGPALPTATRLEGAANADQILLSKISAERLMADDEVLPFKISDLGEHHFKGIEPIRVYQVCASDLPSAFPPIAGKRETARGNLPANLSSLLGRETEMSDLLALTHESRLITLVGPGGIGKTKLAIEFARSLESAFSDGAWLVDLSTLERDGDVWLAISEALLISPQPGMSLRAQVLERLQHARAILLIDNCEHVLDEIADAVAELGLSCSRLLLLNTSRRTLGVEGEAIYGVASLQPRTQDSPAQSAAVRLFIERGRLADQRFQPAQTDLDSIQRICASLEYIPLAIEIAAGQVRRVSLAEIEKAMARPLDLPARNFRSKAGRHQTLRQTLEWSYDLLDPNSRLVFERLAVFSGPFREEQALAVCAADMHKEADILRGIDELVELSLLTQDAGGSHTFRMLQTVQAFGREKLDASGLLETTEARHGEVFAARCRELGEQLMSADEAKAAIAIYDDMSNLRAAFERAVTRDLELAAALAAPLFWFNYLHRAAETGAWYERILVKPGAADLELAPLLFAGAAGHAFHDDGDKDKAAGFIAKGLSVEAGGLRSSQGWLSGVAGQMAQWAGDTARSIECHTTAFEQARQADNVPCEITSLSMAAFVKARTGDIEGAERLVAAANQAGQTTSQPTLMGYIHYARGSLESHRNPAQAIEEYQTSVEWANMAGNDLGVYRIKQLISDLRANHVSPFEAVSIYIATLADLPIHGTAFYGWLTIRSLFAPLAALNADKVIAVLAGALSSSPLKLDRAARAAATAAQERLGDHAFEAAQLRGARFSLAEVRAYIIDFWQHMDRETHGARSAGA